eukprot:4833973-Alexandrium_andersonii.AAC.1
MPGRVREVIQARLLDCHDVVADLLDDAAHLFRSAACVPRHEGQLGLRIKEVELAIRAVAPEAIAASA